MRLAAFNVENLFDRPRVFSHEDITERKRILQAYAEISELFEEKVYTESIKARIAERLGDLGLEKSNENKYVILRVNRGRLVKRPKGGGIEITADGRGNWVGWVELKTEPVDDIAMKNTARVIHDVNPDVLGVVEADDRISLDDFSKSLLLAVGGKPFDHVMLIDGNDRRGIDLGVMTRDGFEILSVTSHIDDRSDAGKDIFSRDCPEYCIETPAGNRLWLLVNHFKSKGYGSFADSNARRKAQAARTAVIYNQLLQRGEEYIAVAGDFNDTPASDPLKPLLAKTNLKDISQLDKAVFDDGGYPGTYKLCSKTNKIDYILLSPALSAKTEKAGVFRTGMWPGKKTKKWECYESITASEHAASDHACLWVDLDI